MTAHQSPATIQPIDKASPEAQSANLMEGNLAQLKALFPEAFTEGRVDFEVLKQLLGTAVDEREEKYGLNWHGKRRARQLALTPSTGTLRPCPEESVDWDTTQNLFIEGDNLEVLKLLQKSYAGKVKLIYIDPPYNTGKDFVYPDNFQDSIKNYLELTGQVEGGQKISSNTDASGRFHTDWLNMIYPRLRLAKNLLTENGVIFVSIDDAEQASLRKCLDEVFGEENFVEQFVWKKSYGGGAKERYAVTQHEYCLMYARDIQCVDPLWLAPDAEAEEKYYEGRDEHFEKKGPFRLKPLEATKSMDRRENLIYPITAPDGTQVLPKRQWWWSRERAEKVQAENGLHFAKRPDGWSVSYKQYLIGEDGEKRGAKPFSIIDGIYTQHGTSEIRDMFDDEVVFSYPKPVQLLSRFIEFGSDKDSIVLDFFAGSGTLGHAVLAQNSLDGGTRRYILVQLPEPLDPEAKEQSTAAAYCDRLTRPRRLSELTKERLRRAGKAIHEKDTLFTGDVGFRVFKLDSSNIRAWNPRPDDLTGILLDHAEHLDLGRSEQDVLYELLLKLGLDLAVPMESRQIAGKTVHSIGAGALMACLSDGIGRDVAEPLALGIAAWQKAQAQALQGGDDNAKPVSTKLVFKDSAFADDVAKTNLAAILSQHGLDDVRSI
jgi:adenine-specific DNA-methyltransferase